MHIDVKPEPGSVQHGPEDPTDTLSSVDGGESCVLVLHIHRQQPYGVLDISTLKKIQEPFDHQRGRQLTVLLSSDIARCLGHGRNPTVTWLVALRRRGTDPARCRASAHVRLQPNFPQA